MFYQFSSRAVSHRYMSKMGLLEKDFIERALFLLKLVGYLEACLFYWRAKRDTIPHENVNIKNNFYS